jgi:hypothetical protein
MEIFSKLIIENRSDLGTMECLKTVNEVIKAIEILNFKRK